MVAWGKQDAHQQSVAERSNTHFFFFFASSTSRFFVFFCRRVRLADCRGRTCLHSTDGVLWGSIVESAPFKLTAEFVDLMDGPNSACFKGFREARERFLFARPGWMTALGFLKNVP